MDVMKRSSTFAITLLVWMMLLTSTSALAQAFITTWKTDNPGVSANNQISIPVVGAPANYNIYWEQVGSPAVNGSLTSLNGNVTITFPSPGTYRVEISGLFPGIAFGGVTEARKLMTVEQWGSIAWQNMNGAFWGCNNLVINASDAPNISAVTDMSHAFSDCTSFNQPIGHWNVSSVQTMFGVFRGAAAFNQDIGNWDVRNVTTMSFMFESATAFNQDIGNWDVSSVTNMGSMFVFADAFNADIGDWIVTNVTDMSYMFGGTNNFNQDISTWDMNGVFNIAGMFYDAESFNQDISSWNITATNLAMLLNNAGSFNQDLGSLNISNVTQMGSMLSGSGMSRVNYENTLIGWAAQSRQTFVTLDAFDLKYCSGAAVTARAALLAAGSNWTINGDAFECPQAVVQLFVNGINTANGSTVTYNSTTVGGETLLGYQIFNTGNIPMLISSIDVTGDFSLTNAAPTSIAAGSNASFLVRFSPTASGIRNGTFTINSNATVPAFSLNLTGTGQAPVISFSLNVDGTAQFDGDLVTYPNTVVGASASKNFTVTNTGNSLLTISVINATGDYSTTPGSPPVGFPIQVAVGSTTTISVFFSPTAVGTRTGTFAITTNAPTSVFTINLTGSGLAAPVTSFSVTVDGTPHSNGGGVIFSSIHVGQTETKQIILTNTGNTPVSISSVTATSDFSIVAPIPTTIAVGSTAIVNVSFTPPLPGARSGTFTINSNAAINPFSLNFSANALPALQPSYIISVDGTMRPFGATVSFPQLNLGQQTVKDFIFTNNSSLTVTISSIVITSPDFVLTAAAPTSIAAGTSVTVGVRFTPGAVGLRQAAFTVNSNASTSMFSLDLQGTGQQISYTTVVDGTTRNNGTSVSFTTLLVGQQSLKTVTLNNTGSIPLLISDVNVTGDFSIVGSPPTNIAVGGSASMQLRFSPTGSGTRNGVLTITTNAAPPFVLMLSGDGIVPAPLIDVRADETIIVSGQSFEFPATGVGTDNERSLQIVNTGTAALVITDVQTTGDFVLASPIPPPIPPNDHTFINVTFVPTELGERRGSLVVLSNGQVPVYTIELVGKGDAEPEVYNVITVVSNGKHDFLKIRNITLFPTNHLTIFDRWGGQVYEKAGYDNLNEPFAGVSKNGNTLPEGTYYYVLDKGNGTDKMTGFILLRR